MSAGNNDWAKNFKQRLEDVGWRVEMSGTSHYKVHDADGKLLLTFSGTPGGGSRGMMNALGQAKRAGLLTLETQVKLQREKERLQKLEDDRAANDVRLAEAQALADAAATEDAPLPDLGSVNGVRIVAIAPAMIQTPIMKKAAPLTDGSEIMLSDHTVLYRCDRPAATAVKPDLQGVCHRTFESATGLLVHISSHKYTHNNAKNFGRKQQEAIEAMTAKTSPNGVSSTTKLAARLSEALDSVTLLAQGLDSVRKELTEIQDDLGRLHVADTDTLTKAAKFDTLSSSLKSMLS